MHKVAHVVGAERAADATLLPTRAEHEMIDDQLATPVEQVGERVPAVKSVEDIFLLDLDPGQRPPLGAQLVAPASEFLLRDEQSRARGKPFLPGNNLGIFHAVLLGSNRRPIDGNTAGVTLFRLTETLISTNFSACQQPMTSCHSML